MARMCGAPPSLGCPPDRDIVQEGHGAASPLVLGLWLVGCGPAGGCRVGGVHPGAFELAGNVVCVGAARAVGHLGDGGGLGLQSRPVALADLNLEHGRH